MSQEKKSFKFISV